MLCDKLNIPLLEMAGAAKANVYDWKVHIVHSDNRYFLKTQKISLNLGRFYVVLMILFLSACFCLSSSPSRRFS